MYTCTHRATCCMCVCDLEVDVRNRDEERCATFVLRMTAGLGGGRGAQMLFWGLSIMGSPWHPGMTRMRRTLLCLNPGRSGQGPDVVFGPRTANANNEAASDGGISTDTNGLFVLHVQEIDTPTLSTEFQLPAGESNHGFP